ncbi:beta-aspartyl-peptidase (threonine type) [Rhizomicrobium palustre]|uniref:Isoaspartyl peptidase n=1 Tax=Rhizomicrobium palustre TaxID=189966 RepID=A0A846N2J6_9PROT|nr:isoaspartyl peptidase/L-asparaginase [Rhizomicrobium palustre]NIK90158.1 beta-aspartyl-peptidase (threonine type) [Rhizomicrobium palustre]
MKAIGAALAASLLLAASAQAEICSANGTFAIAVHGGAFSEKMDGAKRLEVMQAALEKARASLKGGASALDVVSETVQAFENSGVFNAGRGAIANAAGQVEADASIMDGNGLRSGAVASMTKLKNPSVAARLVMEAGRHVLVVGDRGQDYAIKLGAETVTPDYFGNTGKPKLEKPEAQKPEAKTPEHGTVGAVALDRCGHLAALTSTGGFDAKVPGRVGDSPIVGAGVYAADGVAAFSGTGHGEFFIRNSVSKDAADRIRYGKQSLAKAMKGEIFGVLKPLDAEGGLIGVDAKGHVGLYFNTMGMFRGYATDKEAPVVAQYGGATENKRK